MLARRGIVSRERSDMDRVGEPLHGTRRVICQVLDRAGEAKKRGRRGRRRHRRNLRQRATQLEGPQVVSQSDRYVLLAIDFIAGGGATSTSWARLKLPDD